MSKIGDASSQPEPGISKKAIAALVFGIGGLGLWLLSAVPAILFALLAKNDFRKDPLLRGRMSANLGLLLGMIGLVALPLLTGAIMIYDPAAGKTRIAHFHIGGALAEAPADDPVGAFMGQPSTLFSLLTRLKNAAEDRAVKAAIITVSNPKLNLAEMEELREAVIDFTSSDKKLFAYCEEAHISLPLFATLGSASRLSIAPTALLDIKGLYGERMYLKDGLAALGITADVVHIGDYKAAGEMLGRSEPSDAAKENMNWLFDGQYESCVNMLAESRHKTPENIKSLIDAGLFATTQVLAAGLVDAVECQDELVTYVKSEYGENIDIDNDYHKEPMPKLSAAHPLRSCWNVVRYFARLDQSTSKENIGLIYLEGNIVPGYGGSHQANSGDLRAAFKEAMDDDSIKAVVLRVNSPGGSVTASETIYRAAAALQKQKPLIVSMGPMAASGGYYVSCGATAIFADETTLTASIGVIGNKLVSAELWKKLGVNWFPYQRGANADIFSRLSLYSERQRTMLTEYMETAYETFKEHIMTGRGAKLSKEIDEIAGGRVFTGKQALDLGLVDKIGGLQAAIAFAAQTAGLEKNKYEVRVIPEPQDAIALLVDALLGRDKRPNSDLDATAHRGLEKLPSLAGLSAEAPGVAALLEALDPSHADAVMEMLGRLQLIQQEGVAIIMPEIIVF